MKRKISLLVLGVMLFSMVVGLVSAWREPFPPFNDDDDPPLFHVPEPGTVVGLVTALSALGVLALKKRRG
jgi:hypothetical protein